MLISLAISSIIAILLLGGTNLTMKTYKRTQDLNNVGEMIVWRKELRTMLRRTLPASRSLAIDPEFIGTATSVTFYTVVPPFRDLNAQYQRVSVSLIDDKAALITESFDAGGEPLSTQEHILADNVSNLRFRFFGGDNSTEGWQDSWTNGSILPALVALVVSENSVPEWPDFTVRLAYRD